MGELAGNSSKIDGARPPAYGEGAGYRPDIDGLRAIAVLAVVVYHAFPRLAKGGFTGVDVFFVISGFLISGVILDRLESASFTFLDFYCRRIRRIFPALFVVLLAVLAFGWLALLSGEYKALGKYVAGGAGFVSNLLLWRDSGYFAPDSEYNPLLHLWSLGVEEQFYFIMPVILVLTWKKGSRGALAVFVLACISFAVNIAFCASRPVATFYLPTGRFWEMFAGVLLSIAMRSGWPAGRRLESRADGILYRIVGKRGGSGDGWFRSALSIAGLLAIVIATFAVNPDRPYPGFWALLPVGGTFLLILSGKSAPVNRVLLSRPTMVKIGLISYPLYLWHWPLLSYGRVIDGKMPDVSIRLVLVAVAFILSILTFRFVERPMRVGGRGGVLRAALACLLVFAVGGAGALVYAERGFPDRSGVAPYEKTTAKLWSDMPGFPGSREAWKKYMQSDRFANDGIFLFNDVGGDKTVAVLGDSHALWSYYGICNSSAGKGANCVLFSGPLLLPFVDIQDYFTKPWEEATRIAMVSMLIETIKRKDDITAVFIVTRGPLYVERGEIIPEPNRIRTYNFTYASFREAVQKTVTELAQSGKRVFIVSENPELPFSPMSYVKRPLRENVTMPKVSTESVLARQGRYLDALKSVTGATLVNSLEAFCPDGEVVIMENEKLLYYDGNHLSVYGSAYQARVQLDKVIDQLFAPRVMAGTSGSGTKQ